MKLGLGKNRSKLFLVVFLAFATLLPSAFYPLSLGGKAYGQTVSPNDSLEEIKSKREDYLYKNTNPNFEITLGSKKSKHIPKVTYSYSDRGSLSFSLKDSATTSLPGLETVTNQKPKLIYRNTLPKVDISYEIEKGKGIKEEIILNSPPADMQGRDVAFVFEAETSSGVQLRQTVDGLWYFTDESDNYLFHIEKPFMEDAKGVISNDVKIEVKETQNQNLKTKDLKSKFQSSNNKSNPKFETNSKLFRYLNLNNLNLFRISDFGFRISEPEAIKHYTITVIASGDWLRSASTTYPVAIDPTVTHNDDSEFTGQFNRVADSDTTSATQLETFYGERSLDPYTVLLMHFNEANGTTVGIKDMASSTRVITANGNASTTSYVTQLGMGNSAAFDGTGDYFSIPDSDDFSFGSGDFTIETWVNFNTISNTYYHIYHQGTSGQEENILWWDNASDTLIFRINSTATCGDPPVTCLTLDGSFIPNINTWYHVAITRNINDFTMYINGVTHDTAISTYNSPNYAASLEIGGYTVGGPYSLDGKLDDFRILKGRALTPEEIKAAASRRPYAVYTSPVLDASTSVQWDTLNWTEGGVNTGDGETLYDATSLVAQWNFNETSGTTATSSTSGSCQTCAGTLNGFSYTASQDQATTTTGWTANNKRWGQGSLMFDGSNDYVSVNNGAVSLSGFSTFTATMWIKQNSVLGDVSTLISNDLSGNQPYTAYINTSRQPYWYLNTAGGTFNVTSPVSLNLGEWYFLTFSYDGSRMYIHVNGILATSTAATGTMDSAANASMRIGMRSDGSLPFSGIIDSTAIYSRALSAAEILSSYNAGNIEIQTRTGATSDPNDGTWEAWKPVTGETQLLSMDSDQGNWNAPGQIDGYTKLLIHGNATTTNSATTTHTITPNGNASTTSLYSKFGGGAMAFDGTGDYLSIPDSDDWYFGGGDFTIDFWVQPNATAEKALLSTNWTGGSASFEAQLDPSNKFKFLWTTTGSNGAGASDCGFTDNAITTGKWTHISIVRNSTTLVYYVNGTNVKSCSIGTDVLYNSTESLTIGSRGTGLTFNGWIDELRISKGIARWTSNFTPPPRAYGSNVKTENEMTIKQEGTASTKLTLGAPQIDGNTVALWHFEETGTTTGIYLYDETANNNDATTTTATTRPVDGIFGKARYMSSQNDYLSLSPSTNIPTGSSVRSADFWAKPIPSTMTSGAGYVFGYGAGASNQGFGVSANGGNWWFQGYSAGDLNSNKSVIENKWTYVAVTYDGTTLNIYIDGILANSATKSLNTAASAFFIGQAPWDTTNRFVGSVDELRMLNRVLSPDEIAETYRMGANHHLTRQVSAVDLSSANKLAFNIASDRPGTYLETMLGESDYANYELASSTLALSTTTVLYIKGDEIASSTSIKDSSFSGKAITANGDARTSGNGKIGNAMYFDGTGDYLSLADSDDWAFGTGDFSIDTWLKYDSVSGDLGIYGHGASNGFFIYSRSTDNTVNVVIDAGATMVFSATWTPVANTWYKLTVTRSGNNWSWYVNGNKIGGTTNSSTVGNYTGTANVGSAPGGGGNYFPGFIDELRILKGNALSADQIRQAYEYGLRSHQVTIDFGATLQPSDLISSASDYNFSLTATTSGLSATTSGLYLGDKIIIKENRSGAEYTAQGTVNAINTNTGAITVPSWDSGSSFPSGGFTQYATVFKWQREYFDLTGAATTTRNAITNLTIRPTNGAGGRTVYLDDFRYNTNYLTASSSSAITSSNGRYMQYRVIFSSWDSFVSPFVSSISTAYTSLATMFAPMIGVSGGGFMSF